MTIEKIFSKCAKSEKKERKGWKMEIVFRNQEYVNMYVDLFCTFIVILELNS